ncbi:hypothetical protein ANCDUO_06716 [Ancylostoma duodenale]|uniref:Uncharacterized protein n=1 Tax=Ancylostoma duodenale TaxID=51022 RepID=A0A0C2D0Z6_9BILA|nr:hypothetical protein ANCDUO_06716 [Ancylostoma duodenale]
MKSFERQFVNGISMNIVLVHGAAQAKPEMQSREPALKWRTTGVGHADYYRIETKWKYIVALRLATATVYVDKLCTRMTSIRIKTLTRLVFHVSVASSVVDEPLPADVYWSLPFNMMIKNQQVFVACHKIYGNLKINQH